MKLKKLCMSNICGVLKWSLTVLMGAQKMPKLEPKSFWAGALLIFAVFSLNLSPALQRVEEAQQERRELLKAMRLLQEEKQQLQEEQKRLAREREQERETCCLLRTHNQVKERDGIELYQKVMH